MVDVSAAHDLTQLVVIDRRVVWPARRVLDVLVALSALPLLGLVAAVLAVLNPRFNKGPVFYRQARMGCGGASFQMIKFRSMTVNHGQATRRFDEPLERQRITPLGAWLRRLRIDELPQILNILRGDMTLIGPRPDAWEHARAFIAKVPDYSRRLAVRPGITGLAQVELGYTEGLAATTQKVAVDLRYIRERSWRLDALIMWRTVRLVAAAGGR
ncbi:MAG: sugar transferase [Pseudomonadota bacterium]